MYAVEFETSIKDGLIQVPDNFKDLREVDSVRLVVMYELDKKNKLTDNSAPGQLIDETFDKYKIDLSNLKLDRDMANER